ncbi:MAG: hypothetical protein U0892_16815 [Pirellulales bacterium]
MFLSAYRTRPDESAQLWAGHRIHFFKVEFEISYRLPLLAALMLKPRGPGCKQLRDQVKKPCSERRTKGSRQEFKNAKEHVHEAQTVGQTPDQNHRRRQLLFKKIYLIVMLPGPSE